MDVGMLYDGSSVCRYVSRYGHIVASTICRYGCMDQCRHVGMLDLCVCELLFIILVEFRIVDSMS